MNKKVWYVLQSIILLEDGVSQADLLVKHQLPIKYIFVAKKIRDKILISK